MGLVLSIVGLMHVDIDCVAACSCRHGCEFAFRGTAVIGVGRDCCFCYSYVAINVGAVPVLVTCNRHPGAVVWLFVFVVVLIFVVKVALDALG